MDTTTAGVGVGQTISAGMVRIYKDQLGRGPTKARTFVTDDMVVTVLGDSLTKAETTLTRSDQSGAVRDLRRTLQGAMTAEMSRLIEETMQREVICLLSDHSPDPDYAVEVILLEPLAQPSSNGN